VSTAGLSLVRNYLILCASSGGVDLALLMGPGEDPVHANWAQDRASLHGCVGSARAARWSRPKRVSCGRERMTGRRMSTIAAWGAAAPAGRQVRCPMGAPAIGPAS